jgi:hypothetical protein|tara:strand:- start:662 stop:796 length:135 start_codon:yes stop_codon:yes gene_type:complete
VRRTLTLSVLLLLFAGGCASDIEQMNSQNMNCMANTATLKGSIK